MPTFADPAKPLTPRQQRFVAAYTACGNASKAAHEAGYRDAKNEGHRLVHRAHIQAAIQKRMKQALSTSTQGEVMTPEELLIRLTRRARSSMEAFIQEDEQGRVHLTIDTEEAREALGAVRHFKRRTIEHPDGPQVVEELEIGDPFPALRLLAQWHGLLEPNSPPKPTTSAARPPTEVPTTERDVSTPNRHH